MSRGPAKAIFVFTVVVMTSGCAAGAVDAGGGSVTESSNAALPPSSTPVGSVPVVKAVDLGFGAEEEQITGDWGAGWIAPFPDGDERFADHWSEDRPNVREIHDDDNGCTILMEGGRIADDEMLQDDRLISDTMLAANVVESPSPEDLEMMAAVASDDALWQEEEVATVDFRVWHGASKQGGVVIAARGFGAMAVGMALTVMCPTGADAVSEYREFVDEHARIFIGRPKDK